MRLASLFTRSKPASRRRTMATESTANPSTAMPAEHEERLHAEIMSVLVALMIAMLLAALDQSIVATALPRIASDLNGVTKLSWVATAYLITSAIATPIYGKLGDLYGRKKVFQSAIILFLVGSALCGLSQSMNELVLFRALQGIGAGGLISLVLAIIGDIIPPRQRGRYQGYFGAVFGLSSVAGPVLGGIFANAHTFLGVSGWRWIFYINVPLGAIALSLVAARLHLHKPEQKENHIDYLGSALLSAAVLSIVFVSVWAGIDYTWGSWQILSLLASTAVFGLLFIWRERKAPEPIIPLHLFKSDIMSVSFSLSFLTGIAMFAALLYIPLYQQIVRGYLPTKSGLLTLPLVVGLMIASLVSGRLISKFGRYRPYPILGTILLGFGMWLFSHLGVATPIWEISLWMMVLGLGLGQLFQVPTLAVQNTVERKYLGTATSTVTFARSIGGALGGAIFGTILITRLTHYLTQVLPGPAAHQIIKGLSSGVQQRANLPPSIETKFFTAYVHAFHDLFLLCIPFVVAALLLALFLREVPLRSSSKELAKGEGFEKAHTA